MSSSASIRMRSRRLRLGSSGARRSFSGGIAFLIEQDFVVGCGDAHEFVRGAVGGVAEAAGPAAEPSWHSLEGGLDKAAFDGAVLAVAEVIDQGHVSPPFACAD